MIHVGHSLSNITAKGIPLCFCAIFVCKIIGMAAINFCVGSGQGDSHDVDQGDEQITPRTVLANERYTHIYVCTYV